MAENDVCLFLGKLQNKEIAPRIIEGGCFPKLLERIPVFYKIMGEGIKSKLNQRNLI